MLTVTALVLGGGAGAAFAMETTPPVARPNILPKPPVSRLIRRKGDEKPAPARQ
jgi:hypothetical protein